MNLKHYLDVHSFDDGCAEPFATKPFGYKKTFWSQLSAIYCKINQH